MRQGRGRERKTGTRGWRKVQGGRQVRGERKEKGKEEEGRGERREETR